ncbi:hypothetical protein B7G54_04130 [Burkholderia puraquae]|uniref:Uncharacterized protein n=1 Tax=Burkholderia puraquae TaxID=1904757 RepID=A0A1X1PPY8_9BURK|nr:hypothetical protein [Burkholderia puraquae]ORT89341.1 hypothetical protein B7G54_04130 [Burkholderia puraquae]CAB3746899.1 hypothetical protein LMG29660_00312 [Burkholderia puraquae]
MTPVERPEHPAAPQPKPSWGPGRNAALSFVAFATIFGLFAYTERDTAVGHPSVTHDISGAIGAAVGKYRKTIVTMASRATGASGTSGASGAPGPAPTRAQATPPAPPTQVASASAAPEVSTVPPVTLALALEPDAAPRPAPRTAAKHRASPHAPPVTLAAGTHAATAYGRAATRHGAAHRAPRTETLAGTGKRMDAVPKPRPYGTDTAHMQTASITHAELESARALAKARSCAVIDEWNCVEQNASRALAIDPKNSESRALLGQAIRNRL